MLRRYTPLDYGTVKVWADARNYPLIPPDFLPSTGYIHEGYCVGFLYKTDSALCWFESVISNPNSDWAARDKAMDELFKAVIDEAKRSGFKAVFTSARDKKLLNRYQQHDFVVADTEMINLIRRL